jgi:AcrR family transcriptional regulator
MENTHPTKVVLIKTVVEMMNTKQVTEITSEDVLKESGISKGSLYHHFEDFNDLLEHALIYRFTLSVDRSIEMLTQVLTTKNREEFLEGIHQVTLNTQSVERLSQRKERVIALSAAALNPRMAKSLGREQERLTQALADLFREAKERGWGNPNIDPRTAAVLVQAYTLGKIVDDFTEEHLNHDDWIKVIDDLVEKVIFPQ